MWSAIFGSLPATAADVADLKWSCSGRHCGGWGTLGVVLEQRGTVPPDSSPSLLARVLAFSAIVVAGVCGGLIGFAVMDLTCDDGCTTTAGLVGLGTAVGAAVGTGVVTVLTLRASAEWRAQQPPGPTGAPSGGRSAARRRAP